jgi:hypothetical protein
VATMTTNPPKAIRHVPERAFYPVHEACHLWGGLPSSSFYRLVHSQQIRLIKLGRRTYVPAEEVERISRGNF